MSSFLLKLIAIICMTIDHAYKLIPNFFRMFSEYKLPLFGITFSVTGLIVQTGRMAFPIFAYFIAEGSAHTKSLEKYLSRLLIFGLISELPFDFAFSGTFTMQSQNVMWTFFLGVLAIYLFEKSKPYYILSAVCVLICAFLARTFHTDYSVFGVILIFSIYIAKGKHMKLFVTALLITAYYLINRGLLSAFMEFNVTNIINRSIPFIFTLLTVPLLSTYNGKRGIGMKWFFYIYYPLHIFGLMYLNKLWI